MKLRLWLPDGPVMDEMLREYSDVLYSGWSISDRQPSDALVDSLFRLWKEEEEPDFGLVALPLEVDE